MATFNYVAMDKAGKEVKGNVEAEAVSAAVSRVRELGFFPTKVTERKERGIGPAARTSAKGKGKGKATGLQINIRLPGSSGVSTTQITLFTRQMSTLLDAGLPLLRGLNILSGQLKPGVFRDTLEKVSEDVEGGSTFSEALSKFPKIFNNLYVNMVKAGEAGGVLETTLTRLAEFGEKEQSLKGKIKSAMVYPIFVMTAAGGIVTFLVTFILPTFAEMFADMGANLPGLTKGLISVSEMLRKQWYIPIGAFVLMIIIFRIINSRKQGKYVIDKTKLKIPIFGTIVQRVSISRFARTLGTLITSGVPILQALTITRETSGNEVVARSLINVHDRIREGENMAPPLAEARVFPAVVTSMVEVGEETGSLDTMLSKIANTYDEEVDRGIAAMVSIIEPLMLIVLGAIVGTIVISLFLPLIQLGMLAGGTG